jgi:putative spermidine/putrescine transport system ATP-binding protein
MMIAGFTDPTHGDILIAGRSVTATPPEKREIGVVFQNYALFPHLTVERNVSFPLEMRGLGLAATTSKVQQVLDLVGLGKLATRYPHQLSGGQQQRVALARALVFEPAILLMDEPLGALDKQLRERMQHELRELHRRLQTTILYVTHDQREALMLADRVVLMHEGRVVQIDSPRRLYREPANRFAAEFIGDCNFLPVEKVTRERSHWVVDVWGKRGEVTGPGPSDSAPPVLAIRPHAIRLMERAPDIPVGRVSDVVFVGDSVEYVVALDGERLIVRHPITEGATLALDHPVGITWDWGEARLL